MNDSLLPKTAKRKLSEALAACARCKLRLDVLRQLGQPEEEMEQRVEHLERLAEGAISLDQFQSMPQANEQT